MTAPSTVDAYIEQHPPALAAVLQALRVQIRAALPDAVERIAYGMPTYTVGTHNMIHFAAFKRHISVFPGTPVCQALATQFGTLISGQSTIRFAIDTTFPQPVVAEALRIARELTPPSTGMP